MEIDAKGIYYRDLNRMIRSAMENGESRFVLRNVNGQRYIADGIDRKISMDIYGTPGQDMAAFMKGPDIVVHGNAQDGIGNTMDDGRIVIRGMAGDIAGYGMRGGSIFIRGDAGYRVGIHMKAYRNKVPAIVIGGKAGDFLGEYMAGGIIVLLGMYGQDTNGRPPAGGFLGTGMHGGVIYVRGGVDDHILGKGLAPEKTTEEDREVLGRYIEEFCAAFDLDPAEVWEKEFVRISPKTHRPYGNMYAY
jgi:glutamate synthase domain-containing protein 3